MEQQQKISQNSYWKFEVKIIQNQNDKKSEVIVQPVDRGAGRRHVFHLFCMLYIGCTFDSIAPMARIAKDKYKMESIKYVLRGNYMKSIMSIIRKIFNVLFNINPILYVYLIQTHRSVYNIIRKYRLYSTELRLLILAMDIILSSSSSS